MILLRINASHVVLIPPVRLVIVVEVIVIREIVIALWTKDMIIVEKTTPQIWNG